MLRIDHAIPVVLALVVSGECVNRTVGQSAEQYLEGAMSGILERELERQLAPLVAEASSGWGHQARVWTGEMKTERYKITGPAGTWTWGYRPAKVYRNKNDGVWKKSWVRLENTRQELNANIRDVRWHNKFKNIRFQVFVRGMLRGEVSARQYKLGQQLWSATAHARARISITVNMEVGIRDGRLRWKALDADIKYHDVVVDRVGHVGGYAAQVLGDAFTGAVHQWFSDRETQTIENAQSAIMSTLKGSRDIRTDLARVIEKRWKG